MRSKFLFVAIYPFLAFGQPPPGYYDPAAGLTGPLLKQALNAIITGHTVLPNSALWAAFELTDARLDGTVWDLYSDVPGGTPAYVYDFVDDQCGIYDGEGDCFNREHTFPQSWYGNAAPMSTDLFHLYPTDAWVNQQRGNWPFGPVTAPDWTSTNGSKRGPCAWPGCNGTVFEPIAAYKGDLARGYFYMLTRYLSQTDTWTSPMMEDGELTTWAESLLLSWHEADPVSTKEVERNNMVFAIQHNRNPYIDDPQWVHAIWGPNAIIDEQTFAVPLVQVIDGTLVVEHFPRNSFTEARIFDPTGRAILTASLNAGRNELTLDLLGPGMYVVMLRTNNKQFITRIVR